MAPGISTRAVTGIVNGLQAISAKLLSLPRAAARNASLQGLAVAISLDNLARCIGNVVEDVVNLDFDVVDDMIYFVVTIAKDMFRAIVNTVKDALHAITALFKWIRADIEAVFLWLAFLFD